MNEYEMSMSSECVKLMHRAIMMYKERWAGGDPAEQEYIWYLEYEFKKLLLEDLMAE